MKRLNSFSIKLFLPCCHDMCFVNGRSSTVSLYQITTEQDFCFLDKFSTPVRAQILIHSIDELCVTFALIFMLDGLIFCGKNGVHEKTYKIYYWNKLQTFKWSYFCYFIVLSLKILTSFTAITFWGKAFWRKASRFVTSLYLFLPSKFIDYIRVTFVRTGNMSTLKSINRINVQV